MAILVFSCFHDVHYGLGSKMVTANGTVARQIADGYLLDLLPAKIVCEQD